MKRTITLVAILIQFVNLFAQNCSPDSLMQRSIQANATDDNITWEIQKHQIFLNPDCVQNDKLLIHLVGTFDNPLNTTYFPGLAANNGFKVINLKYPNNTAAVSACANSNEASCFQNFRQEIVFGEDSSAAVDVNADDCILNRIEKLLIYLDDNHPLENWDSFLTSSEEIDWSNILVSGHSQGGGHAAYIAKEFDLSRALMFAAPNDYSDFFSAPADWLSLPSATADTDYFAFGNLFDNVVDFEKQFEVWDELNLLTQVDSTNVEHNICNYNNAQVLYTSYGTATGAGNHSSVVLDAVTPLSGDEPVFTQVWEYMLGICAVISSSSEPAEDRENIKVFPNPITSSFQIEGLLNPDAIIDIYNVDGSLVKRFHFNNEKYDISELEAGVYQVLIYDGEKVFVKRVVKY